MKNSGNEKEKEKTQKQELRKDENFKRKKTEICSIKYR